jgi:DNA-binding response OmpR family regulator
LSNELEDPARTSSAGPAAERGPRRPVLLVVEDEPDTREALVELFSVDFDVLTASDGVEAVALSRAHVPDLVLADLTMPRLGGLGLLDSLCGHPRTAGVPLVFLSGQSDSRTIVDCFRQGAADFVAKPGRPDELRIRLKRVWEQASQLARLESLARTDALTGLYNFRALQGKLEEELARAVRYGTPLALLLIDLDHLKTLNDREGHEAGNAALEVLAEVLRDELREVDPLPVTEATSSWPSSPPDRRRGSGGGRAVRIRLGRAGHWQTPNHQHGVAALRDSARPTRPRCSPPPTPPLPQQAARPEPGGSATLGRGTPAAHPLTSGHPAPSAVRTSEYGGATKRVPGSRRNHVRCRLA